MCWKVAMLRYVNPDGLRFNPGWPKPPLINKPKPQDTFIILFQLLEMIMKILIISGPNKFSQ